MFDPDDLDDYFLGTEACNELKGKMEDGTLGLIRVKILKPAEHDGMIAKGMYSFDETVAEDIFSEVRKPFKKAKVIDLADSQAKSEKQLFYNPSEQQQIERLANLLTQGNLRSVFEKLKEKGLRTGFTCLFYGAPGAGKTETAYQLARKTGRNILATDVAELRDCYVGETEKNVRRLFWQYRMACD